jgi:hypothetical protein
MHDEPQRTLVSRRNDMHMLQPVEHIAVVGWNNHSRNVRSADRRHSRHIARRGNNSERRDAKLHAEQTQRTAILSRYTGDKYGNQGQGSRQRPHATMPAKSAI